MVYDCGACCAKYVLCFFNFVFFLAGSAVLIVGILFAADKNTFIGLANIVPAENVEHFARPEVIQQASYILIGIGAFIFIVSFLGYCGALRESQCLLTTYGICIFIILILEITAGCLALAYKQKAEDETRRILKSSITNYYAPPDKADAVTVLWDQLQVSMHCCGVDDYRDFKTSEKWNQGNKVIPESCCFLEGNGTKIKPVVSTCTTAPNEANSYYKRGCFPAVMEWLETHLNTIIGIGIGLGVFEVVGIFLAFCLCKSINAYIK